MTSGRVLSVGSPPTFGQMVSRAVDGAAESVSWVPTVTAAETVLVDDGPVDVVVVSPGVKEADTFGFCEFVSRVAPSTAVVLVRDHTSASIITSAMRAGARDVVDLSRGGEDLREAVDRALAWSSVLRAPDARMSPRRRQGTLVAIFSSKGGSGKTFVATNLALAIAKRWAVDTAVVDLDVDMGDVYSYYGLEPKLAVHDLMALGDRTDREGILAAGTPVIEHLWAYGAPPDPAVEPPAGEAVGKLLRSIRDQFALSIVDATADYSDQALAAFDLADTICLVAALDVVGIRHLAKALETLQLIGVPRDRIRVILNRADSQVGLSPQQVERIMHLKVDAQIPSSRLVPVALNRGVPVYLDEPRSEVAASIDALADLVAGPVLGPAEAPAAPQAKRRFWRFGRDKATTPVAAAVEVPAVVIPPQAAEVEADDDEVLALARFEVDGEIDEVAEPPAAAKARPNRPAARRRPSAKATGNGTRAGTGGANGSRKAGSNGRSKARSNGNVRASSKGQPTTTTRTTARRSTRSGGGRG